MTKAPPPPTRGRPKTLDSTALVDLAMRAYWTEGPTEVSLNAICQRAGVSKPSVYREFGNDDGLMHAALDRYAQTVLIRTQTILAGKAPFAEKIRALSFLMAEDPAHAQGCLFVKMRAAKPRLGPKTAALVDAMDQATLDAFMGLFTQAKASGAWSAPVPPALAARYIYAQIGLALDLRARAQDPSALLALALTALAL